MIKKPTCHVDNFLTWQVGFVCYNNFTNAQIFKTTCPIAGFFCFFSSAPTLAEEVNPNAAKERKEELQKQLDNLDSQIEALDSVIQQLGTKVASYEVDIAIVNAKIKKAKLQIQRLDAEIAKTKTGIVQRTDKIKTLSDKSEKRKILWRNCSEKTTKWTPLVWRKLFWAIKKCPIFRGGRHLGADSSPHSGHIG